MAKVALLIGVSEYGPGLNPLPGAVKDVEANSKKLRVKAPSWEKLEAAIKAAQDFVAV